ncbi:MAG: hydroxyphenylacetyl-CoA thioesterase PaaI [Nocardioidaceae bacterium]
MSAARDPAALARRCADLMWADDQASQSLGMSLDDVAPGRAALSMTVRPDMVNGHGIGHGGFTFALADSAFAFACNSHGPRAVAFHCSISYLGPSRLGDVLVAQAVERHLSGRTGVYDITVSCEETVVAEFRGTSRTVGGSWLD